MRLVDALLGQGYRRLTVLELFHLSRTSPASLWVKWLQIHARIMFRISALTNGITIGLN